MILNKLYNNIAINAGKIYMKLYGLVHPIDKKVLFSSFCGNQYSDNPRAISEKLHELYPDYKIVWHLKDFNDRYKVLPDYVEVCSTRLEHIQNCVTSFCIVQNIELKGYMVKRHKQYFIQTWHGDLGFKKILCDSVNKKTFQEVIRKGSSLTDLMLSGSDFYSDVCGTAFRYKGEILKIGTPRNDQLIKRNIDLESKIRSMINVDADKKILLYAPTYKNGIAVQAIDVDLVETLNMLEEKHHCKWVCFTRAHNGVKLSDSIIDSRIINVSDYPDMADLLVISDMLITDYSSCAGDMIRAYKPVILAQFNIDDFINNYRDLYYNPEDSGFLIAHSQEELNHMILGLSDSDYIDSCRKVMNHFGVVESGNVSEEVCKIIDKKYKEYFQK